LEGTTSQPHRARVDRGSREGSKQRGFPTAVCSMQEEYIARPDGDIQVREQALLTERPAELACLKERHCTPPAGCRWRVRSMCGSSTAVMRSPPQQIRIRSAAPCWERGKTLVRRYGRTPYSSAARAASSGQRDAI